MIGLETALHSTKIPLLLALGMTMTPAMTVDRPTSLLEAERSGLIKPSCLRQTDQQMISLGGLLQFLGIPLLLALGEMMTTEKTVDQHTFLLCNACLRLDLLAGCH